MEHFHEEWVELRFCTLTQIEDMCSFHSSLKVNAQLSLQTNSSKEIFH